MVQKFIRNSCLCLALILLISAPTFSQGLFDFSDDTQKEEEEEEDLQPQPIIINGDTVEYSPDSKEFSATGKVVVVFKGTRLSCRKLVLNSVTKDCQAEGDVRLQDGSGIIEGEKLEYNFESKRGIIYDAAFRSNPYFGRSEKMIKESDREFISKWGYLTTCDFNKPHWRMKSKKINFFPGDKVQIRDNVVFLGEIPVMYMPHYNHSLKDPMMQVQMLPGSDKIWGPYLLTAWRYNITEDIKGRIYLDYRANYGIAEGFATNYDDEVYGDGDFKLYYTSERANEKELGDEFDDHEFFERYFIRWRHKLDLNEDKTNIIVEYFKINDSKRAVIGSQYNILKDYFPLEYEKDQTPMSYVSLHRSFAYSSADLLFQKRVNPWYSQTEYLPEVKFSLPSINLGDTRIYFENDSSYAASKTMNAAPAENDDRLQHSFSTSNQFSYTQRLAFITFNPSVTTGQSFTDIGTYGSTINNTFSGGASASTKFYRVFDLKTEFLNLDINALRHIITPAIDYSYSNSTDSKISNIRIGGEDATRSSSVSFGIENKLQTKRAGATADLLDFRVNNSYTFKTEGQAGQLSDFEFNLELYPYPWLSLISDAKYDVKQGYISEVDYDLNFNFGEDRTFGLGQRYKYKGSNDITYQLNWRLNPKWRVRFYHRINNSSIPGTKTGLREQDYSITRDLHCWSVGFHYNVTTGKGNNIWMVCTLKAFPEMEFDFDRRYNEPKPGSQSEPNM